MNIKKPVGCCFRRTIKRPIFINGMFENAPYGVLF